MSKTIVVTRHAGLIQYLLEIQLITKDDEIVAHATKENVLNKDVVGVLPLSLARWANTVTEVPLNLPQELRGTELNVEAVRSYAGKPVSYVVRTEDEYVESMIATAKLVANNMPA
jgi:putative CRISPR-associated protein (TIGR02620 family)